MMDSDAVLPSQPAAPPSDRPKVVIEDPHTSKPKNPLKSYLIGAAALAGVLLIGLIVSFLYQHSSYKGLDAQYNETRADLVAKNALVEDLNGQLTAKQQDIDLYKGDQASLSSALISARENVTDKINELTQCQNSLLLAQGEIKRLNELETTKCDTMVEECKSDCNLAIDQLYVNVTSACKIAVDNSPNATGTDIKENVEDAVDVGDYKFS